MLIDNISKIIFAFLRGLVKNVTQHFKNIKIMHARVVLLYTTDHLDDLESVYIWY